LTTETNEGVASLVELALLDEVTRGVGKEEETEGKDSSPCELSRGERTSQYGWLELSGRAGKTNLDTDGNSVSSRVLSV